jgi:UDP-N-acetylglucosamine--N-acetylmuramyl-(pentapeptide) pyrophosphoryl-undecaprenol N-acetylglucosamine transferase
MSKLALIAAGGTGGHLFPGQALAAELVQAGWRVHLATDTRVDTIAGDFPAEAMHVIPSATISPSRPFRAIGGAITLARGYFAAKALIADIKPDAVIGFGGYPTVPPILAASTLGVPSMIHDQNAVMGRANRFLASRVDAIGTAFPKVKLLDEQHSHKVHAVGVPVRKAVLDARAVPYTAPTPDGPINLLVFGGSQGASVMREIVPEALSELPEDIRLRLHVVQQARGEDITPVEVMYASARIEAEVAPFFADMPQRIADAHILISRSGASTVAERAVIGRPGIMVPLPGALDQDQLYNARALADAGGGIVIEQDEFTPRRLREEISSLLAEPAHLKAQAAAARVFGVTDAAARLADVVVKIAKAGPAA